MESATETINGGLCMKDAVIQMMSLNKIKLSRNSRRDIKEEDLSGLMQSIKEQGLLQPIGVSKATGGGYSVCYGNRRFMACSRIGMKTIPVVVRDHKKQSDEDMANLTENIQRRNISLVEGGRYVDILMKQGLAQAEIAVRLGTNPSYIASMLTAFREVPKEYRDDIEVGLSKDSKHVKQQRGKISLTATKNILNASKNQRLSAEQTKKLFHEAKVNPDYNPTRANEYAKFIKHGKDPVKSDIKTHRVNTYFVIEESERIRLVNKYIDNGPYRGLSSLFRAILAGKISDKVKVLDQY